MKNTGYLRYALPKDLPLHCRLRSTAMKDAVGTKVSQRMCEPTLSKKAVAMLVNHTILHLTHPVLEICWSQTQLVYVYIIGGSKKARLYTLKNNHCQKTIKSIAPL